MGFFTGMISAAVKTVLTPVAIVKDIVNIASDEKPDATKSLLESASQDVSQATEDLADGEVL
jgi:hypothetical protein